ncbi:transcriptional adapter 2-beta-like isoform X2 [Ruditapes philippinarum]|uniref:transcriptional adapter 2-beta-like isoform X2 n=1 Tax=Ruditapes philippinarum TaxID=129788 RepID=UPI00295B5E32|nr:transcriptional adapter 2-beta-like isoform X2 [Ruditapes philippinarum]
MSVFVCNNCQSEISGHGIKCIECPDIDLCLQCFSLGAEVGNHKRDHQYNISTGPIIGAFNCEVPWTLAEETMLLDAVEQYGFGNWEDVANHVESKSPEQSEYHYSLYFIKGNIGKVTFLTDPTPKVTDHTCPDGPLSPSISTPISPIELSIQEQHALGYMPLRDDFEREHDNEAETLVSSLMINYDDDDLDIAVKLAQVERYRLRLKERDRRKQFAREHGLITSAAQAAAIAAAALPGAKLAKLPSIKSPQVKKEKEKEKEKKLSKEDREFQEKMKPFAQCHSCKEHEDFLENHQKERELKNRIKDLFHCRKNGITKLEEVEKFEEGKIEKEEKKKESKLKKLGSISQGKRLLMASKNVADEEKLDILIDESGSKDDEDLTETKEMSKCPGYDLLSGRERKLCNTIGMTPANYMTVKTCIVKDYLHRRNGYPVKIRYPSGMDKTHRRRIMSFLADNGWIGLT